MDTSPEKSTSSMIAPSFFQEFLVKIHQKDPFTISIIVALVTTLIAIIIWTRRRSSSGDRRSTTPSPGERPTPSQQGDAFTCTAHALGKTICAAGEKHTPRINFIQGDTINQAILLANQNIVREGAWPVNWNGKSFILKENGVSAGNSTDKTYEVRLDIRKIHDVAQYDPKNKEYVLVVNTDLVPQLKAPKESLHCVYIERRATEREGDFWQCLNSWGEQDGTVNISVGTEGNKFYEVGVTFREMNASNSGTQSVGTSSLGKLDQMKLILEKISEHDYFKEELKEYLKLPSTNINLSWTEDGTKLTLLHYAVQEKNEEAVKILLELGADPNTAAHEGGSPLHLAAKLGSSAITTLLLNKGAHVDQLNNLKNTPLGEAARFGNIDVAQLLLKKNANANNKMISGWTPLHAAVASTRNTEDMVCLLLQSKADPTLKASSRRIDPTGKKMTPIEIAKKKSLHNIVAMLNNE